MAADRRPIHVRNGVLIQPQYGRDARWRRLERAQGGIMTDIEVPDYCPTPTTACAGPAEAAKPSRWRSRSIMLLQAALTGAAVAAVILKVDISAAWRQAATQQPTPLLIALALMLLQVLLGAMRWHVIRTRLGARVSFSQSFRLFYIAIFFNSYVWGSVSGDILRAWLSYQGDRNRKLAVTSVVLDKAAAVAGVAILVIVCTPLMVARLGDALPLVMSAAVALAAIAAIIALARLERLPTAWLKTRIVRLLQALGGGTRLVFFNPGAAAAALGFAILAQIAFGACAFALATSLKINVTLVDCIALLQPVALVSALPISLGGWGIRETTMIVLFGLVGVSSSAALVLSVQLGVLSLVAVLPGGAAWLFWRRHERQSGSNIATNPR